MPEKHGVEPGMSERRAALIGWRLFVASALFFAAASIRAGDLLALVGSLLFLVACFVFLIPLLRN